MAEKIERGKIKPQQLEHFTLERVEEAFEDKSIPQSKVILGEIEAKIKRLEEVTGATTYRKQYDLTIDNGNGNGEIVCEDMAYDNIQQMYKIFGEVKIKVPRKSSYYVNINVGVRFDEGEIEVLGVRYPVQGNMTFVYEDVEEIMFSTNIYLWLRSITVQEYKQVAIPTKVSQLENDLKFVAVRVENEDNLIIEIK